MLRPQLDMYCKCSKKCDKPTICAKKVCAEAVDADLVSAFVGDFDEIDVKTLKAEVIEQVVPPGAPKPSIVVVLDAPGAAPPPVSLPVFGSPFGGVFPPGASSSSVPGAISSISVEGSDFVGTVAIEGSIPANTVLAGTFGAAMPSIPVFEWIVQDFDLVTEGYVVPSPPVVCKVSTTGFEICFTDGYSSASSRFAYRATLVVA